MSISLTNTTRTSELQKISENSKFWQIVGQKW